MQEDLAREQVAIFTALTYLEVLRLSAYCWRPRLMPTWPRPYLSSHKINGPPA